MTSLRSLFILYLITRVSLLEFIGLSCRSRPHSKFTFNPFRLFFNFVFSSLPILRFFFYFYYYNYLTNYIFVRIQLSYLSASVMSYLYYILSKPRHHFFTLYFHLWSASSMSPTIPGPYYRVLYFSSIDVLAFYR